MAMARPTHGRIRRDARTKIMNGQDHQDATLSQMDAWIDRVKQLPTAPALVGDLLALFRDPDRDVDRVVEVISHCPSLTAEILRRCNSASFSLGEPVQDMFTAISRIGFYEVYCMVTTLMAAQTLDMAGAERGVDLDHLWQHSVLTAVAAEELARHIEGAEALGFTVGLLHDVGKLILAVVEQEQYAALTAAAERDRQDLVDVELARYGVDHAALGGHLLRRWNLPDSVVEPVRFHHRPEAAGDWQQLAAAAQLADHIAHRLLAPKNTGEESFVFDSSQGEVLGLTPADLEALVTTTWEAYERVKDHMSRH